MVRPRLELTDAAQRTALLAEVAAALSSAGTLREVMAALVDSLTPALCDACEVAMPEADGVFRRVAVGPGGPFSARGSQPIPDVDEHPLRAVFASGEPMVLDAAVPVDRPKF